MRLQVKSITVALDKGSETERTTDFIVLNIQVFLEGATAFSFLPDRGFLTSRVYGLFKDGGPDISCGRQCRSGSGMMVERMGCKREHRWRWKWRKRRRIIIW